ELALDTGARPGIAEQAPEFRANVAALSRRQRVVLEDGVRRDCPQRVELGIDASIPLSVPHLVALARTHFSPPIVAAQEHMAVPSANLRGEDRLCCATGTPATEENWSRMPPSTQAARDDDIAAMTSTGLPIIEPMEAKLVDALPADPGWQFEPKWDGFRCIA